VVESTGLSIDLFAVTDTNDVDDFFGRVNFVDNTVVTNSAGITTSFIPFERLALVRVGGEGIDGPD